MKALDYEGRRNISGERVRQKRTERKITQAELAAILQARLQDKGAPCPGSKALTALVKEAHVTTLPQLDPLEKQLILSAYRSAPVPEKEERLHKNV